MKEKIVCPLCARYATLHHSDPAHYECKCGWDSHDMSLDISYSDNLTAPLSNLFPHKFTIDGIHCMSMESFIQSLREKDPDLQKSICEDYSGLMAYKMRLSLRDWRGDKTVYWRGKEIHRFSPEYTELITRAYDALFEQNILFRTVIERRKRFHLIHSKGHDDPNETLLTEMEYRCQLIRLTDNFLK